MTRIAAVKMLLWELWTRNRTLNIIAVVCAPLYAYYVSSNENLLIDSNNVLIKVGLSMIHSSLLLFPGMFYLTYPMAVCGYAQEQGERHKPGFPARLFTLPLPTWLLVAVPLLTCVAILALEIAMYGIAVPRFFADWRGWWLSLVIITSAVCILAMDWTLSSLRVPLVFVLFIVASGLIGGAIVPIAGEENKLVLFLFTAAVPLLLVLGTAAAFWGVAADRRGSFKNIPNLVGYRDSILDRVPRKQSPFASPVAAQLWFEQRALLPLISFAPLGQLAVIIIAYAQAFYFGVSLTTEQIFMFAFGPPTALLVLCSLVMGHLLANSGSTGHNDRMGWFQAGRPLSDELLLRIKLRAGTRTLAMMLVLCFGIAVFYSAAVTGWPIKAISEMGRPSGASAAATIQTPTGALLLGLLKIPIPPYLLILWMLMSGATTMMLTNNRKIILSVPILFGLFFFTGMFTMLRRSNPESEFYTTGFRALSSLLLLGLIGLSIRATAICLKHRLIALRSLLRPAIFWVPLTLLWFAGLTTEVRKETWPELLVLGAITTAVLPLAMLPLGLLALSNNRHAR